jgi:hypothetical protein
MKLGDGDGSDGEVVGSGNTEDTGEVTGHQ